MLQVHTYSTSLYHPGFDTTHPGGGTRGGCSHSPVQRFGSSDFRSICRYSPVLNSFTFSRYFTTYIFIPKLMNIPTTKIIIFALSESSRNIEISRASMKGSEPSDNSDQFRMEVAS